MSKEKYMAIDLLLMGSIMCLLEFAGGLALNFFPGEAYTLSCVLPVALISIMRWGKWGVTLSVAGGIAYALLYGGSITNILVYAAGNGGIALSLVLFKVFGKEKVRDSKFLTALYCFTGYLGVNLLRGVFAAVLTGGPITGIWLRFFTTEALSAVIAFVALIIARAQNGLFEDQVSYLIRLKKEEAVSGKQ